MSTDEKLKSLQDWMVAELVSGHESELNSRELAAEAASIEKKAKQLTAVLTSYRSKSTEQNPSKDE